MITDYDLGEMEKVFKVEKMFTATAGMGMKLVAEIRRLQKENRNAKVAGIKLAAEVAGDYNNSSSHPYLISECILAKLNVLKRKPRKNLAAAKISMALTFLEHKVGSLEATTRFMAGLARRRAAKKK